MSVKFPRRLWILRTPGTAAYQVCKDDEEFSTPYISVAEHEALLSKASIQVGGKDESNNQTADSPHVGGEPSSAGPNGSVDLPALTSKDYPFADEKQKNNWLWEFVRAELGADIAGWLYQRVPEALEKLRKRIKPPTIGLGRDFLLRQHQEARIKHQREQVTQTDNNLLKAAKAVLDMFEPANKHSPVPLLWLDDAVREAGKAAPAADEVIRALELCYRELRFMLNAHPERKGGAYEKALLAAELALKHAFTARPVTSEGDK